MLVQIVHAEVVERSEGIGDRGDGRGLGSRGSHRGGLERRSGSRGSGANGQRRSHELGREGVLSIVHEVLEQLQVLLLELLAGSLETIDLLQLLLLLLQGLADDVAR